MSKQKSINDNKELSNAIHPKAVYTSRLLDFKNLPEPKNAENDSIRINKKLSNAAKINNTSLLNVHDNKVQIKINDDRKNQNLTKFDKLGNEWPVWEDEKDLTIPELKENAKSRKKNIKN
jgi:hypothetical protein